MFAGLHNDIGFSVDESESYGWPPIERFSIDKAWKWLSGFGEFSFGFSKSKLGRALNAFSYLFYGKSTMSGESPIDNLWALIGIEALFSTGLGIQKEVREKVELLLGPQRTHKNKFKETYKIRSGLVHGGLDFPSSIVRNEGSDIYEKYNNKTTKSYFLPSLCFYQYYSSCVKMIGMNWSFLMQLMVEKTNRVAGGLSPPALTPPIMRDIKRNGVEIRGFFYHL